MKPIGENTGSGVDNNVGKEGGKRKCEEETVTNTFVTKKVKIEKEVKLVEIEHVVGPVGLAHHEQ